MTGGLGWQGSDGPRGLKPSPRTRARQGSQPRWTTSARWACRLASCACVAAWHSGHGEVPGSRVLGEKPGGRARLGREGGGVKEGRGSRLPSLLGAVYEQLALALGGLALGAHLRRALPPRRRLARRLQRLRRLRRGLGRLLRLLLLALHLQPARSPLVRTPLQPDGEQRALAAPDHRRFPARVCAHARARARALGRRRSGHRCHRPAVLRAGGATLLPW